MTKQKDAQPVYRTAILPGLGQVQIPQNMTDADVLAAIQNDDVVATPKKKTKKKP